MKQLIQTPPPTTRSRTGDNSRRILSIVTICILVAAGLVFTGCDKESKVATIKPEDVKPVDVNASADEQQNQRIKMAVAMRDNILPPEPTLKLRGGEPASPEVMGAFNQLLLRAMVQRREPPESLEELRKWPLPKLPTPPAGKRIVYDAPNCIIRLDPP
jgi:hypothetical protein